MDTNVLLTGAFLPQSRAGRLCEERKYFNFITTEIVIDECFKKIEKNAPTALIFKGAKELINAYCARLNMLIVPDTIPNTPAPIDSIIFATALSNKCDVICTYNIKDFPPEDISVVSPFGLLKMRGVLKIDAFIEYPLLSNEGTLFLMTTLHHKTSMGSVLTTSNGTHVFNNDKGYVKVTGNDLKYCNLRNTLIGESLIAFFFRYNVSGNFEASLWFPQPASKDWGENNEFTKLVLTEGKAKFVPPITPKLMFEKNHNFFGSVINVSGLPRYVYDKQIHAVIRNRSLECAFGSQDMKYLLSSFRIIKLPNGEICIELPSMR